MNTSNQSIYLDYAATTPCDPRVVESMLPYFTENYGNPSSVHKFGRRAERAIEEARDTIAGILNCRRNEIVFTSCGSESDNLALRGTMMARIMQGNKAPIKPLRFITAHTEHHAVSHTVRQLVETGHIEARWLPLQSDGKITLTALQAVLQDHGNLVSVMYGNNEVGTIQPIAALAEVTHHYGGLFHTDAVQAAGQLSLDVKELGVDMLSLSAHKFYGPKGVGLLYVREGLPLIPAQTGGGQENDRRAGTHNVPLIVGMAKALELAYIELDSRVAQYRRHRDRLIRGVLTMIPGAHLTGAQDDDRLPNHASFVFDGVNGNTLLMHLDMNGISASSGSACNTGNPEPSEVLIALGIDPALALGSLRLTIGKQTTDAEIDHVLNMLPEAIAKIRGVRVTPVAL